MRKVFLLPILAAGMLFLTGCENDSEKKLDILRKNGIEHMKNRAYSEAIESFEKALLFCDEKMPQTKTDITLYIATCQYHLNDMEALLEACDRVLAIQDNGDAYYLRGVANIQNGAEQAAEADFDKAAELNSRDYQMLLNIYHQYELIDKSAIGDKYIRKALEIPSDTMEEYYQKGYIYYYLGEYSEALDELAIPVDNKEEDATLLMGEAYLSLGDSVRARNIYQQYLNDFKESAQAYNGLALCDLADHAYEAALTNIGSGLGAKPNSQTRRELLYNEIVAYEMKLDFETAKVKAESFVETYPEDEDGLREYAFLSTR